jgi:hypothetical protein
MKKTIVVQENIRTPAAAGPRVMVWLASIVAAPFTMGASLIIAPAIYEAGVRAERRRAANEIDRIVPFDADTEMLDEQIRRGRRQGRVNTEVNLGHMGLGRVTRETEFRIDERE